MPFTKRVLTKAQVKLLGTDFDRVIAEKFGISYDAVRYARISRGIESFRGFREEYRQLLANNPTRVCADKLGVSRSTIHKWRKRYRIPMPPLQKSLPSDNQIDILLGSMSDYQIAKVLGISRQRVHQRKKWLKEFQEKLSRGC